MSSLYKETTHQAYIIAAAILLISVRDGEVEAYCREQGKSEQETAEIAKAINRLIKSLERRSH